MKNLLNLRDWYTAIITGLAITWAPIWEVRTIVTSITIFIMAAGMTAFVLVALHERDKQLKRHNRDGHPSHANKKNIHLNHNML